MQDYFNDEPSVLQLTEKIINKDILYNDTSLVDDAINRQNQAQNPISEAFSEDNIRHYWRTEEGTEIFEWYRVTDWLAEELINIEEPVLDNDYGTWWGRTCCGQSIEMDGTIQKVARRVIA